MYLWWRNIDTREFTLIIDWSGNTTLRLSSGKTVFLAQKLATLVLIKHYSGNLEKEKI